MVIFVVAQYKNVSSYAEVIKNTKRDTLPGFAHTFEIKAKFILLSINLSG